MQQDNVLWGGGELGRPKTGASLQSSLIDLWWPDHARLSGDCAHFNTANSVSQKSPQPWVPKPNPGSKLGPSEGQLSLAQKVTSRP